jgi:hypothetical protein
MSGRHRVHDATGVVVENDGGNQLISVKEGAPSDSAAGYETGSLLIDSTNKRHHINVGTAASSAWARVGPTREVINVTSATAKTLVLADSGSLVVIDFAGAINIELPEANATNIGWYCDFHFKQAATGTVTIDSSRTADLWYGTVTTQLTTSAAGKAWIPVIGSSDDRMVMDAVTKGRLAGGYFRLEIAAANMVVVSGSLVGSGSLASPFT